MTKDCQLPRGNACSILLAIILASTACLWSQPNELKTANGNTAEVFGGRAPKVFVFDSNHNLIATIPITAPLPEEPPPAKKSKKKVIEPQLIGPYFYVSSVNAIYVVVNLPNLAHNVTAVNLNTNKVETTIPVGSGNAVSLSLSAGEKRLACYAAGLDGKYLQPGQAQFKSLKGQLEPTISVIDTGTNSVTGTYHWIDEFGKEKKVPGNLLFTTQILNVDDDGFTVIQSNAGPSIEALAAFKEASPRPVFFERPKGTVKASIQSLDKRTLVLAVDGGAHDSMLIHFDLEKESSEIIALNDIPVRFLRLGAAQEAWLIGDKEMRAMTEDGKLTDRHIGLNDKGDQSETSFLGGYPGETIIVGADHIGMMIVKKDGDSTHKVAIVNMKTLKLDGVITTMSAGRQAAIKTGRFALAFSLSVLSGMAASYGVPAGGYYMYPIFTPNLRLRNMALATDNKEYLYALDLQTHEVSMIDVKTVSVFKRMKVDSSTTSISLSGDGKKLVTDGKKGETIDVRTAPDVKDEPSQSPAPAQPAVANPAQPGTSAQPEAEKK